MTKEQKILTQRQKVFIEETSLMLGVAWNTEDYSNENVAKVNDSIVNDYFDNPVVKKHLSCVDGICKNVHGVDVRIVVQNYAQHFKLVHNIKPIA